MRLGNLIINKFVDLLPEMLLDYVSYLAIALSKVVEGLSCGQCTYLALFSSHCYKQWFL